MKKRYSFCLIPGCFLCIHPGHIFLFEKAKEMCESLIVVLAHDKKIKEKYNIKDNTMKDRKKMLEAIKYIDHVIEGYEKKEDFLKVLDLFPFDAIIFCKSHDIPKEVLDTLKNIKKDIDIVVLDCYKKEIFSTRKVLDI